MKQKCKNLHKKSTSRRTKVYTKVRDNVIDVTMWKKTDWQLQ